MDNDLKQRISQLRISDAAKEVLQLSGISVLEEANTYDIDNFTTLLSTHSPDVVLEIKKLLRKYGLPNGLKDLKLSNEVIKVLNDATIFNTAELLTASRSDLYLLFKANEEELDQINRVFEFYGINQLTEEDFDEHAEILKSQQDVADINLQQRIQKEVKKIRKGYGSRTYNHLKIRLASPMKLELGLMAKLKTMKLLTTVQLNLKKAGYFVKEYLDLPNLSNAVAVKNKFQIADKFVQNVV